MTKIYMTMAQLNDIRRADKTKPEGEKRLTRDGERRLCDGKDIVISVGGP